MLAARLRAGWLPLIARLSPKQRDLSHAASMAGDISATEFDASIFSLPAFASD